jgi:olefin beta-lactone synthetase
METQAVDESWPNLFKGRNAPLNLADEFTAIASLRPEAAAVILTRREKRDSPRRYESLTFKRCLELAEQYAHGLREYGIERGETVLILVKPMLDMVPVFLALWKIGAVPVLVDPGGSREHKLKAVQEIGPKALIGIPIAHLLRVLYPKTFQSIAHSVVAGGGWSPAGPTLRSFLRAHHDGPVSSVPSLTDDPLLISFTSGSTGIPKGVVYTQGNGEAVAKIMKDSLGLSPSDVCLACHPAFIIYFLGVGATVVLPDLDPRVPAKADPAGVLDVIRAQKPRVAFMQLPIIRNLVKYCAARKEKIPHLQKILTTGASVSIDLVQAIHQVLEEPEGDLYVMYGATEALSICYASGREILASAAGKTLDGKGTYLGRPAPGLTVQIIGITDQPIEHWRSDLALSPGQIGEICVSGPVVTPEYMNRPEATRKAKIQGAAGLWHRLGDAGYLDDNGCLWYCGRIADRVEIDGGFLYSDLVEPIFNEHPSVRRSALVGVSQAGSSSKRPVLIAEPVLQNPGDAQEAKLSEELQALARRHPNTSTIEDILVYQGEFPVDIRHNAKIRRDLLTSAAARQVKRNIEKLHAANTILFQGHRISYYDKGQGEPILFLHNAGNDHRIWDFQLEYFSRKYRTVAADSLGYGRSENPPIAYTLPLYTEMVAAIIELLALAPVTIVATCTGASMALNYTLQHPDAVKRLILFHIATEKTARGGNLQYNCRLLSGRPWLARALSPLSEAMLPRAFIQNPIIRGQYGENFEEDPEFLEHLHELYSKKGQATCYLSLFSNWETFAPLDQVVCPEGFPPVHVFWGASNKVLPLARGREFVERFRPQTFDVIEGGGHLVMREKPELINPRIEALTLLPKR